MICTNRIYKGETFEVSIPFMVEGWSDLYVEYFTNGQYKVTRTADELIIDEYTITAEFSGNDLDLLADGVLRYTLYYTLEGVAYTKSTNTPYYLKTPVAYSAMTPTDYYHEGEVVGKAEGYLSGYTQAESTIRSNAVSLNVTENGVYSANTDDNIYFNNVVVNVETPYEDCTEAYVSGMNATFIGAYFNDDTQWAEIEDVHIPKPISGKSVVFRIDFAVFDEPTEINKKKVLLSSKDMNNQDAPYLEFYVETLSGTGGTIRWYAKIDVRYKFGVKTFSSTIAVNTMYQLYATMSYRNENSFTWSWRVGTFISGTEALSYLDGQTSMVDGTMTINGTKDSSSTETPVVGIRSGLFIEKIVISAEGQQKNNVKWVNGNMRDLITHRDNAGYCMVNGEKTIKTISGLYLNGSTAYSGEYLSVVNEIFESGTTIGYQSGITQGEINANNEISQNSIELVASASGVYWAETPSGIYYKSVEVPFVYSFRVVFDRHSNAHISSGDISNIQVGYMTLTPTKIIADGGSSFAVFGYCPNTNSVTEGIGFDIPTSVYNTFSNDWYVMFLSINGNETYNGNYGGGIGFAPYRSTATTNGDTTRIFITFMNPDA